MGDERSEVVVLPGRSARSCTECSRRKTACDRQVPCGACVKRGAASSCTAAPSKRKKANVDTARELNERQQGALEELRLFRQTLDSLKARLPALEYFVANSTSVKDEDAAELDAIVKAFGDPVTQLPASGAPDAAPPPLASTSTAEPPKKRARVGPPKRDPDEGEAAAVQAAIDLEFHSLGRPRVWHESNVRPQADAYDGAEDGQVSPRIRRAVLAPDQQPESPVAAFPDARSLFDASPFPEQEDTIFRQGLERFGFHHSVVHAPTFYQQLAAFRELGDDRFERSSLAWLSLYFALLAVSAKLVEPEQQDEMGWSEAETSANASRWFSCSIACLYRFNFLQCHDFSCLQAIALLVLSGRDAGSATLIASLLSSGLSIAQDMGLHRLISDEAFFAATKGHPARAKAQALIEREIRKRVMWALVHSEWFAIPFKGYSLLSRLQIATPLPLNATDEDLASGESVNRSADEYTVVSWLLQYVEIGSHMASAFDHAISDKATAAQAYQSFLAADKQLEALLGNLPKWLDEDGTADLPLPVDVMRTTFLISLRHKILSIHRPFLAKPSRANSYSFSRRRVIESARAILREAPRAQGIRIWTVLYHISVASFSLTLELYEQLKQPSDDGDAIRDEIHQALPTLEALKQASAIAERGLGLVLPLLADEQRMRTEGVSRKDKRKSKAKNVTAGPVGSTSGGANGNARSAAPSASPISAAPSVLPDISASVSPFASPFFLGQSPDSSAAYPFTATSLPYDPHVPIPVGGPGSMGAAGAPYGYPPPPAHWMYNEQFLYSQLSGLDGSAEGLAPPAAGPSAPFGSGTGAFAGQPTAGAAPHGYGMQGGMGAWGVPAAPFGAALGWDWGAQTGGAGATSSVDHEGDGPGEL
ncbi:hypothetical protein Rhopal_006884-T1 [Rhodotorula paludigena]|uniref:Zn(2)-C6 fungal-type domain-containing protein n=1 Tax=Rhodotorula paludigena TaxID=86838 RepID=A0AAV5GML7_9BASI|nr:hypothetical protein Rhopal_006884-T1 [Rhodotorula paludigena]